MDETAATRLVELRDGPLLSKMLVVAFNFDGTERTPVAELLTKEVPVYVSGWGRVGDYGLVAEVDGRPAGAAWSRLFDADANTYGHVAPDVPEIACVGIEAWAQGKGIGALVFDQLVADLREQGYRAVSLSVEDENPKARAMYERRGFVPVDRKGESDIMLLRFGGSEGVK